VYTRPSPSICAACLVQRIFGAWPSLPVTLLDDIPAAATIGASPNPRKAEPEERMIDVGYCRAQI
jgi:hypothetical protein